MVLMVVMASLMLAMMLQLFIVVVMVCAVVLVAVQYKWQFKSVDPPPAPPSPACPHSRVPTLILPGFQVPSDLAVGLTRALHVHVHPMYGVQVHTQRESIDRVLVFLCRLQGGLPPCPHQDALSHGYAPNAITFEVDTHGVLRGFTGARRVSAGIA